MALLGYTVFSVFPNSPSERTALIVRGAIPPHEAP